MQVSAGQLGAEPTPVDSDFLISINAQAGGADAADFAENLLRWDDDRPALVSIGWANNEIGTVQPIGEIGPACRAFAYPRSA